MLKIRSNAQSICDTMMDRKTKETGCEMLSTDGVRDTLGQFAYATKGEEQPILNSGREYLILLDDSEGRRLLKDTISKLSDPDISKDIRAQAR